MNEEIMRQAGFDEVVDKARAGICPFCNKPIASIPFRDPLSVKEYAISGMCQACQDDFFKPEQEG